MTHGEMTTPTAATTASPSLASNMEPDRAADEGATALLAGDDEGGARFPCQPR
jgi:hypothetical protein